MAEAMTLDHGLELAPAFVVRIPLWPVDSVLQLVRVHVQPLADIALASSVDDAAFQVAYEAEIERERHALWSMTAHDAAFLRALSLSSPEFGERLESATFALKRNKRARRLDGTLYRYLSRAAGRTEPADAWAGVAEGTWADDSTVRPQPRVVSFTPDLRPFQTLLRALGQRPGYDSIALYKRNPTVRIEREITFFRREATGSVRSRTIARHAAVELVLELLADGEPRSRAELLDAVAAAASASCDEVRGLFALCVELGIVVGGLDLPCQFTNAWYALADAAARLRPPERKAWWRAVRKLRRICRRLERGFDSIAAPQLREQLALARDVLHELAGALSEAVPEIASAVLHCDTRMPYRVTVDRGLRARITSAIEACTALDQSHGLVGASAAMLRRHYLAAGAFRLDRLPAEPRFAGLAWRDEWRSWEAICTHTGNDPGLAHAVALWSRCLDSDGTVQGARLRQRPPPFGSIVLRVSGDSSLQVMGISPEPAMTFARFEPLLSGRRDRNPSSRLARWLTNELDRLELETGIVMAEYDAPLEHRPNALAHPRYARHMVSPWSTSRDEVCLDGAAIERVEGSSEASLVRLRDGRLLSCFSFASANVSSLDPVGEALLLSSFRSVPRWIFSVANVPFEHELHCPRANPALTLPGGDGALLTKRRLVLSGETLKALSAAPVAARFREWVRLLTPHALPPLLFARRDQEQPLLIAWQSALAVEVLFEGTGRSARHIILEEANEDGWIQNERGERFIVEIAVPFLWREHCWRPARALDTAERHSAQRPRAPRHRGPKPASRVRP